MIKLIYEFYYFQKEFELILERETTFMKTHQYEKKKPLFETSGDWKLQFDVCVKTDGQVKNSPFPPHIAASKYRPDGGI